MTISYNWLCDYLPDNLTQKPSPEQVSRILTSVGLEVESLQPYSSVRGGMEGLIIGEVVSVESHPNADKLKITQVNIGSKENLQIVCGASNVVAGQKVVVALAGSTLYPEFRDALEIKAAKIRGVESQGMICAEDEIGLGKDHEGILVLPGKLRPGLPAADYFKPYSDFIYEIGLTPNHMDAMSHMGVARDLCAYLSNQDKKDYHVKLPVVTYTVPEAKGQDIKIELINRKDCARYSGLTITGIRISESPQWMQEKLKSIGIRPINNVVDITNFVLQETGQPLHAYDSKEIKGNKIIIKNLPSGTSFITLDEKERKLDAEDLMICDAEGPICIAGVFGGLNSGIENTSTDLFLESAWFNPSSIRRTSFRHGLRTEAATHFEKGMDISGTVNALKRAASLIREYAGGKISSPVQDLYPEPFPKTQVLLKYHYLKKLSGKNYHSIAVKNILLALGFDILREGLDDLLIAVPFHKPDVHLPADLVEEIMRIDGFDHIDIPTNINISPSVETGREQAVLQEKISGFLVGSGFNEIFTNSITNSAYFRESELETAVKMINNLSAELNVMRPSLLETGLESISRNLNRKNNDLRFFEFGKTYETRQPGQYSENNHCCLYLTGNLQTENWKGKPAAIDFYYLKGICLAVCNLAGIGGEIFPLNHPKISGGIEIRQDNKIIFSAGEVDSSILQKFDIRQSVFFADIYWDNLVELTFKNSIVFSELPRQIPVNRDLALIVEKTLPFEKIEKAVNGIGLEKLRGVQLFDIFESEKLGKNKKSMAISFTFLDNEKTLTDKEIDGMMNRIMKTAEEELKAEIRK
ncbi:MAG TPA: phenylalanine--tRNA ligase subunit beta [Puia sp.]|jgi:phenylalanyl-tRNA synthetase beta chain|nr:phenylalanine--tRNA ligase subunit beta [Puia sp.]